MADRAQLERFIEEYADKAYAVAFRLCGSEEEARELSQEAFLKLIRKWDGYDPAQPPENWFLVLLRNTYFDALRKKQKRYCLSLDAPGDLGLDGSPLADIVADGEASLEERLERRLTAKLVREAMRDLVPQHRALLTMIDLQGLRYVDAAAALDCPLNTVRVAVSRAREKLRLALIARLGEEVSHELP